VNSFITADGKNVGFQLPGATAPASTDGK